MSDPIAEQLKAQKLEADKNRKPNDTELLSGGQGLIPPKAEDLPSPIKGAGAAMFPRIFGKNPSVPPAGQFHIESRVLGTTGIDRNDEPAKESQQPPTR